MSKPTHTWGYFKTKRGTYYALRYDTWKCVHKALQCDRNEAKILSFMDDAPHLKLRSANGRPITKEAFEEAWAASLKRMGGFLDRWQ